MGADTASGINRLAPFDMDAVPRLSGSYSLKLAGSGGHRTMDVFRVATAIHLGAVKFLTFDDRQRRLADFTGLEVVG